MRQRIRNIILLLLITNFSVCAQKLQPFTLNGSIKSDSGKMILLPIGNDSYYPTTKIAKETQVLNGKFVFKGFIEYPTAFIIGLKVNSEWQYISSIFLVTPNKQNIVCNIDSSREIPEVNNEVMEELKKFKSSKKLSGKKNDIFLLDYIKTHKNSYVGLWCFVDEFDYAYTPILDSAFTTFSKNVQSSFTYKSLSKKIEIARATAVGGKFPNLILKNSHGDSTQIFSKNELARYTFIDFWFSHCTPCISQFTNLKSIHNTFKSRGLNMIGISVDTKENIDVWKKAINNYQLNWQQYLDTGGNEAFKLNINSYPTNFLLDSNGRILKRNLNINELEKILKELL